MATGHSIGIDLGTTYSCVAVYRNGRADVIQNEEGDRTTPSCVSFTPKEHLVGKSAKLEKGFNPSNTVHDAKRLIGLKYNDTHAAKEIERLEKSELKIKNVGGYPRYQVTYKEMAREFSPEQIGSFVLGLMKSIAETFIDDTIDNAVITVPARFGAAQRKATKDAAAIAKIFVKALVDEPTAAAIAYGLDKSWKERKILIYDLGGGTFDVTVMSIEEGVYTVIAKGGDTYLGGEDFTDRLLDHVIDEFSRINKIDRCRVEKSGDVNRLQIECEQAKRLLSGKSSTKVRLLSFYEGKDLMIDVSQAKFVQLNRGLFQKSMELVRQTLSDAKLGKYDIQDVVLVGGSTRIPEIKKILAEYFGKEKIKQSINPDEAIARGAAAKAALLHGDPAVPLKKIREITPLSLGIGTRGEIMSVIIEKNTRIPCEKWRNNYQTVHDNQQTAYIPVYEGERLRCLENRHLGRLTLRNLRLGRATTQLIGVCFKLDGDGILDITVREQATSNKEDLKISLEDGWHSEHDINNMIEEADQFREDDKNWKKRQDAMNALEDLAYEMARTTLDDDDDLLDRSRDVHNWMKANEDATLEQITYELDISKEHLRRAAGRKSWRRRKKK